MVLFTKPHRFPAIGSFRHKLKAFFFQKNAQTLAKHLVIVCDQYSNCHLESPLGTRNRRVWLPGTLKAERCPQQKLEFCLVRGMNGAATVRACDQAYTN
jgi:hypothetical protein